jgi:hypothetical protein
LLGLLGASLAAFFQQVGGHWVAGFIARNELSQANRRILLISMAVGFLLGAGAVLLVRSLRGAKVAPRLRTVASLFSPLALLGLAPGLVQLREWSLLFGALGVLVFGLLAELAFSAAEEAMAELRLALEKPEGRFLTAIAHSRAQVSVRLAAWRQASADFAGFFRSAWPTGGLACLAWAIGAIAFTGQALRLFRRFALPSAELGLWHAALSSLHPATSLMATSGWPEPARGLGFHPTALLFVPFLRAFPSAETLLVLRAIVSAASVLFVWLMSVGRMSKARQAVLLGVALFWPAWQASALSDFSLVPFAATFLLAGLAASVRGEPVAAAVAFLLTLGCGEEGAALVLFLGLGWSLAGPQRKTGLALLLAGGVMTVVVAWASAHRPDAPWPLVAEAVTALWRMPHMAVSTWTSADRLQLLLVVLAPLIALPLRVPGHAWSLLPGLVLVLFSSSLPPDLRRVGVFVAFLLPAMVHLLGEARPGRVLALAVTVFLASSLWGLLPARANLRGCPWLGDVNPRLGPDEADRARQAELEEVVAAAPPGLLLAPATELAHLPNRGHRLGPLPGPGQETWSDAAALLIGVAQGQPGSALFAPATAAGFHVVKTVGPWSLLAR